MHVLYRIVGTLLTRLSGVSASSVKIALIAGFIVVGTATTTALSVYHPQFEFQAAEHDAKQYMRLALSLAKFGAYSGEYENAARAKTEPSARRPPGYPVIAAFGLLFSKADRDALSCQLKDKDNCDLKVWSLRTVHVILLLGLTAIMFAGGYYATGQWLGAGIAAATVAVSPTILLDGFFHFYSDTAAAVLFAAGSLAVMLAVRRQSWQWWGVSGVLYGLAALTRPAFLYTTLMVAVLIAAYGVFQWLRNHPPGRRALVAGVALAIGVGVTVTPWMARNSAVVGEYRIQEKNPTGILGNRVAYNQMTLEEGLSAFILYVPGLGDHLAEWLLPRESYDRMRHQGEGTYRSMRHEMTREHDGKWDLVATIVSDPIKNTLVSVVILYKMSMTTLSSVLFMPAFLIGLVMIWRNRRWDLAVFVLPVLVYLLVHAGITNGLPRYGKPLFAIYGVVFAYVAVMVIERLCLWRDQVLARRTLQANFRQDAQT